MNRNKPETTLFLLCSEDGKISSGVGNNLDFDTDLPLISGVKEGLHQYYEIEQETDIWSLNSGAVQAKIGVNELPALENSKFKAVNYVIIDNTHLTKNGVQYLLSKGNKLVIITNNQNHPAYEVQSNSLYIINTDDLEFAFEELYSKLGCKKMTVQTGGTLNSILLRKKLIDYVNLVKVPILIGGRDTPSAVGGDSITDISELNKLTVMKLISLNMLENSYYQVIYKIIK